MKKIFKSLTARLTFYILTITAVIFLCMATVFNFYSAKREEAQAARYTSALLQNMAQKIDRTLSDVERTVKEYVPELKYNLSQPDSMMRIVQDMVWSNSTVIGGSIAFEPDYYPEKGRYFMEYVSLDSLSNISRKHLGGEDYDYFNMQWYYDAKDTGQSIWSEPYFDEGGGNILMTTYSCPLMDSSGKVIAIITADVSLEDLTENIRGLRPYPDSYSFILSNKGIYLAHPDKDVILQETIFSRAGKLENSDLRDIGEKMMAGERGTLRLRLERTDVLTSYMPMLRTGWSICCVCPYKTIMSQLGSASIAILVMMLIGLALLLVCIRLIVVHSMNPLVSLTDAAYKMADGQFDYPLPDIESDDEIRKLHDAFVHLQYSLKSYVAELTETTRSKERIESELHIARAIQMSMIPQIFSPFPEWEDLELHAYLRPAKEVGGDFYDFFIRDEKLFFVIGDVSGKGVPASLIMAITRALFRIMAGAYDSPAKITALLNHAMSEKNVTGMFITMYMGVLDLNSGKLTFCNAGHNAPALIKPDGSCSFQETNPHLPIGVIDGFEFTDQEITLEDKAALFVYTDGLTEAENVEHELLGDDRMMDVLKDCAAKEPKEIVDNLHVAVLNFAGEAEQSDDLTMLCLRFHKPGGAKSSSSPSLS